MIIDGKIEGKLTDIRIITNLLDAYLENCVGKTLDWGCIDFISECLHAKIDEIYAFLKNNA